MEARSLVIAGFAIAVVATAFYGEQVVKDDEKHEGRVVINYWEKWSNFEGEAMRSVVDEFNKSQDKVWVNYLQISNIAQKTIMAVSGGIPPDVAGLYGPNTAQYAYNNAVIPLDELAYKYGIKQSDYIPVYFNVCMYKGRLWALPTTPASTALHINDRMLRDAGLDPNKPPVTIGDLDQLDKTIGLKKDGRIVRMGFLPTEPGWWPWHWPYIFGGDLWDHKGHLTMTRPENVEAYKWFASYAKRYGSNTVQAFQQGFGGFDSPQNAFMDEKLATVEQGVWMANFIQNNNPKLQWSAAPFPYPDGHPELKDPSVIDLDILVIPRGAKHPEEAFQFIKFVESQKGMELLCTLQKKHSPLIKQSPGFIANHPNPYIKVFQMLAASPNAYATPKSPVWAQWGQELRSATERMNLGADVKTELQKVQDKMQPIQDQVERIEAARPYGKPDIPEGTYVETAP